MKKTMKKLLSAVLCVLMLVSVVSFQSFALLDAFEQPEIKSVSLSEGTVISAKELKVYFDTADEALDYYNEIYDEEYTFETLPDELKEWILNYYLSDCVKGAGYTVAFKNGNTITVDAESYVTKINNKYSLAVDGWIEYEDYLYAVENNKDVVDVKIEAEVYSTGIFSSYEKAYNFDVQASLVECFVKSIKEASGVPDKIYEGADYIVLEGAQFLIEYADGTEKLAEVTVDSDGYDVLDGRTIEFYEEESVLYIYFMDEIFEKNISYMDFPFEKIEFNDYDITDKGITVNYTITRKDGTAIDYVKAIDSSFIYGVVDELDGYYIRLTPFNNSTDVNGDETIKLYISAGELYSNGLKYEIQLPDELNFFASIIEKIKSFFEYIKEMITALLSKIGFSA